MKEGVEAGADFVACMKECIEKFQASTDGDNHGAARLVQVQVSRDPRDLREAWKSFNASKPENEAGLVECTHWLVSTENINDMVIMRTVVRGIGHVLNVSQALLDSRAPKNIEKVVKYDKFYGLYPSRDSFEIYPNEMPLCLDLLPDKMKPKLYSKHKVLEFPKTEVHAEIARFLLARAITWFEPVQSLLLKWRDECVVCDKYSLGEECGAAEKTCPMLHRPKTLEDLKRLVDIDLLMVELEESIFTGVTSVKKKAPEEWKSLLDEVLSEGERDFSVKYQACFTLWKDLLPVDGHPVFIAGESRKLLDYLIANDKVHSHLRRFLLERWRKATSCDKGKILKCSAVRETDVFVTFEFGYHLFGFHSGKRRFDKSPLKEMTSLEYDLDKTISKKKEGIKVRYFTFMMSPDQYWMNVECIAHRFTDAYELISEKNEPFEAVFKFNKFMNILNSRGNFEFYPKVEFFVMWLEFYVTVAFFLTAKLKARHFPNFLIVIPNSYLSLLQFIGATFTSSRSVAEIISRWTPTRSQDLRGTQLIQDRLRNFAYTISGFEQRVRIMPKILQRCKGDPQLYAVVERLQILAMTLVCNVGKAILPEGELQLMKMLVHVKLDEDAPSRLKHVQEQLKVAEGVRDVVNVLDQLFKERNKNEKLMISSWNQQEREKIRARTVQSTSTDLFSDEFLNENTLFAMSSKEHFEEKVEQTDVEDEQTMEEILKGKADKVAQKVEAEKVEAVKVLQKWWRLTLEKRKDKQDIKNASEIDNMFEALQIEDTMCGICGVYFNEILREKKLEAESVIIGAKSVLNKSPTLAEPSSFQRQQSENVWSRPQDTQTEIDDQDMLKEVRERHAVSIGHIENEQEFVSFKKAYKESIEAKLKEISVFLKDPSLKLIDQKYVEKYYDKHQMEIYRMTEKIKQVDMEILDMVQTKSWSNSGRVQQSFTELDTDFRSVLPYVMNVQERLKDVSIVIFL